MTTAAIIVIILVVLVIVGLVLALTGRDSRLFFCALTAAVVYLLLHGMGVGR